MLFTSAFVSDVMFSHNRANGPRSKTLSIVSSHPPGGSTGPWATSFCCLRLHYVCVEITEEQIMVFIQEVGKTRDKNRPTCNTSMYILISSFFYLHLY